MPIVWQGPKSIGPFLAIVLTVFRGWVRLSPVCGLYQDKIETARYAGGW